MAGHFMVSNLYNLAISIKTFNRMHVLVVVHARKESFRKYVVQIITFNIQKGMYQPLIKSYRSFLHSHTAVDISYRAMGPYALRYL
jgi:hypothetical protein